MMVGSLELEVQMVTSLHVYAGNNQCFFCVCVVVVYFFAGKILKS